MTDKEMVKVMDSIDNLCVDDQTTALCTLVSKIFPKVIVRHYKENAEFFTYNAVDLWGYFTSTFLANMNHELNVLLKDKLN